MSITRTRLILSILGGAAFLGGIAWGSLDASAPVTVAEAAVEPAATCTPLEPTAAARRAKMVAIKGGTFTMGADNERAEERSAHTVTVSDFWIDAHEVTNAEFQAFVEATGYVTIAERGIGEAARGRLPDAFTEPGSMVFSPPAERVEDFTDVTKWWRWVPGANWRAPTGPGSSIDGKADHPVVHVAIEDAYAYAQWAGRSLPTEAQWEYAARGGLSDARYSWGNDAPGAGGWQANTWQGAFPHGDTHADGHAGTAPVGCYEPNDYGLYDMAGNVWEYAQNWWVPGHPAGDAIDPKGPLPRDAARFGGPLGPNVTVKGGSWLCSPVYCARYRPSARQPQELALGTNHIGFRTVSNTDPAASTPRAAQ